MKHFRKLISLLMTVTLVVSMIAMGFGSVTASATDMYYPNNSTYASSYSHNNYGAGGTSILGVDFNYVYATVQGNDLDISVSTTYTLIAGLKIDKEVKVPNSGPFSVKHIGSSVTFDGSDCSANGIKAGSTHIDDWKLFEYTYNVSGKSVGEHTVTVSNNAAAGATTGTATASITVNLTCSHSQGYDDWDVITSPTASQTGLEEGYCVSCGAPKQREIPTIKYKFRPCLGSTATFDNVRSLLYGIPEGTSNLAPFFTMVNCNLSYSSVGTGSVISVMVNTETVKEMTAVIFGDVTGDGVVDSFDVSDLTSVVNFEREYDTLALNEAGDVFDDGYIDATDLAFEIAASVCDMPIDQRGVVCTEEEEDDPTFDYQYTFLDYSYGSHGTRNLLDLKIPEGASGELGLILYIHGGTWLFGSKEDMNALFNDGFAHGYAVAKVNYRYISSVDYNGVLNDIQSAVGVIKSLGAENGVTFNRMMVVGYSAGGHLALMYSYTKVGSSPITPVGVWDRSGPADLTFNAWLDVSSNIPAVFSLLVGAPGYINKDNFKDKSNMTVQLALANASPVAHISSSSVPTIISHGTADNIVPYENAVRLNNMLEQNGVRHVLYPYANSTHGLEDQSAEAQSKSTFYSWCNEYIGAPYVAE